MYLIIKFFTLSYYYRDDGQNQFIDNDSPEIKSYGIITEKDISFTCLFGQFISFNEKD